MEDIGEMSIIYYNVQKFGASIILKMFLNMFTIAALKKKYSKNNTNVNYNHLNNCFLFLLFLRIHVMAKVLKTIEW